MATLTKKDNLALLAQVEALKPPPLNKLQRLVRQPRFTRVQSTVAQFHMYYAKAGRALPPVTTLPIADLVAMLDSYHPAGGKFAVVSKPAKSDRRGVRFKNLTAVLDVVGNKLYRANHELGMVVFWKAVARRRARSVQYLRAGEVFDPSALRAAEATGPKSAPVFTGFRGQEIQAPFSGVRCR